MNFTEQQTFASKNLNLLVTLDQNYIKPLMVMLRLYSVLHTDVVIDLYIAHSSLDEGHFSLIEEVV